VIIPISHPDKVLFPDDGITKGDVAGYYEYIAPVMLPHVVRRPVTLERFHRGIGEPGFFQKDVSKGFPAWLERVQVPKKGGVVNHPIVTDSRSLVWLANQNSITAHVWTSRAPKLEYPDILIFDLDPSVDEPRGLRDAAIALRDVLDELGLPSWIKTSGSKGFHLAVPLDGKTKMSVSGAFADGVGRLMVRRFPRVFTQEFHKKDRADRIYIDTGRNHYSATFAAAYTVRARPGAPVSAPCTWKEVESGKVGPRTFTIRNMRARVDKVGDIWAELTKRGRSLTRAASRLRLA
jgi:bifunctional non-homologous end joining protein LigD